MNDLLLHSTKFDGSLHYRYPVRTVHRSDDRLITFSSPGSPVESYRGSWTGTKHLLSTFWIGRPYVFHVRWNTGWIPEFLYTDITTGTKWNDRMVEYVDLDLDLILRHESADVHLDDEDEFEEHRVRWSYPPELVAQCREAARVVRGLLESRELPFTKALFDWRPGMPVNW